jgi:hypothetical protein
VTAESVVASDAQEARDAQAHAPADDWPRWMERSRYGAEEPPSRDELDAD